MSERSDKTLTLLHLRKTFSEYTRISISGAKELDPNRLLPLFKNVAAMYSPVELRTEFKEAPSFALHMSGFFVREVRGRAAAGSAQQAAISIAEYLRPSTVFHGYSILEAIYFLVLSKDDAVVDAVCESSLPSTLVKAIYLFIELPHDPPAAEGNHALNSILTNLLDKLCQYRSVSEELTKKDDMALLFIASTQAVPPENFIWRSASSRILEMVAAHSLSPLVLKYCREKECIRSALHNLAAESLSPDEIADMLVGLFAFIKDASRISNVMLESFVAAGGFQFLLQFILREEEKEDMIRSVLSTLISLITNGAAELTPQASSGLMSLPSFQMPTPSGNGVSVRNTSAFVFLLELFAQCRRESTSMAVLEVAQSVYTCDAVNYFLLERDAPLSAFIEHISEKQPRVQAKLLEMLEFILFQLHFIPCKELVAFCVKCKSNLSAGRVDLLIIVSQCAFRLLTVDSIIKDAYREVGLLDTLSCCLFRLCGSSHSLSEQEHKLALLATDLLTVCVKGNIENARLFADSVGAPKLLQLISSVNGEWRSSGVQLLKQLLLQSSSDTYLAALQSVISRSASPLNSLLVTDLLKALLGVLRESHKVRILFRKAGGYLSLISLLLCFEATLLPERKQENEETGEEKGPLFVGKEESEVLDVMSLVFKVLTISMRFEPSNAVYFGIEVGWESLTCALRLTGAFSSLTELQEEDVSEMELKELLEGCHSVFRCEDYSNSTSKPYSMPRSVYFACYIMRLLFNMALDNYERASDVSWAPEVSVDEGFVSWSASPLVHAGAVLSLLQLIPSIQADSLKWKLAAQLYSTLLVKALLRPERNQQMMCQVEMPRHLLSLASRLFLLEKHVLLPHLYYMFERLSYQGMHPSQLREFLRLDLPLCCRDLDGMETEENGRVEVREGEGGPLPLSRLRALVSMMTPRDERLAHAPSFVEFDMRHEGFGGLFVPSLAPLYSPASSGRSERAFPPLAGITYSFWLYIDSFSDKRTDAHPLRLLTITRLFSSSSASASSKGGTSSRICLSIQLSAFDRSLLICTDELEMGAGDLEKEVNFSSDKAVRVPLVECLREMEWNHFCISISRSVLKQSQATVFLNGRQIFTSKIAYMAQNVTSASGQLVKTLAVNATIGTDPALRRPSRLRWRMASVFILDEAVTGEIASRLFVLQPHYIGGLQTAAQDGSPLVAEEKIVLSVHGAAVTELTLASMRALYSKVDAEMTASVLGLSAQDASSRLRCLHNSAFHAPGAARAFGAVVVGYLGMRTFSPRSVPRLLDSMGGFSCLFALVDMASDSDGLYAALKAIVSAVRSNSKLSANIQSNRAYQLLGVLLEEKSSMLTTHTAHLVFSLVGTLDTSREAILIPNTVAFEDLLTDLDIWRDAPDDVHRILFEHLYELITDGHDLKQQRQNLGILRSSSLLSRLLFWLLERPSLLCSSHDIIFNLLSALLSPPTDARSLLKLGQAISATLPETAADLAADIALPETLSELQMAWQTRPPPERLATPCRLYLVYFRERLLKMLQLFLLHSPTTANALADQIVKVLGFDWILAIIATKGHSGSLLLGLQLLLHLLQQPQLLQKFREGGETCNGGWLADADSVARNSAAVVLGFSVSAHGGSVGSQVDINPERSQFAGFSSLEHVLAGWAESPTAQVAMLSLLVGQRVPLAGSVAQLSLDVIWERVFGLKANSSVYEAICNTEFCFDALLPIFSMLRSCIHPSPLDVHRKSGDEATLSVHACTVLQMLTFLYQNSASFFAVAHSDEFFLLLLSAIAPEDGKKQMTTSTRANSQDGGDSPDENVLSQPSARAVLLMMKRILVDDLQLNAAKSDRLIDTFLENMCDSGSRQRSLQQQCLSWLSTEVLSELLTSDLLLSSSLPPHATQTPLSADSIDANAFYLCSRLTDALWQRQLPAERGKKLLDLFYGIHSMTTKGGGNSGGELLQQSIMRVVLFNLSRPVDSIPVQECVLETLSSLLSKKYIFLPSSDAWFYCSLANQVFMLSVTPDILCPEQGDYGLGRASAQVAVLAARVWSEIVCSKRSLLEESFRRPCVSELNAARALLAASTAQHWRQFVESQLSSTSSSALPSGARPQQIQQHISSKLNQVASGLSRLASRRSLSTTSSTLSVSLPRGASSSAVSYESALLWLRVHVSLVRQLLEGQAARYHEWHCHVRKWSRQEWAGHEAELTREKAIWGPRLASRLDKFRLDTTEGPCRVRKKLIPNRSFYLDFPYRPSLEEPGAKALRAKVAVSRDSKAYFLANQARRPRILDERIISKAETILSPSDNAPPIDINDLRSSLIRRVAVKERETQNEGNQERKTEEDADEADEDEEIGEQQRAEDGETEGEEKKGDKMARETSSIGSGKEKEGEGSTPETEAEKKSRRGPDNQTLLRLLEHGEQLHSMFRCARIQGLQTAEGLLLFGRHHYYVVDGFTLLKTREIRDLDFLPAEMHDPIVPYTATGSSVPPRVPRLCSKFSYSAIREVHQRRYLLQPIALEVFSADGRNYLLAFPRRMRDRVYEKLLSMARHITGGGKESVSGQRRGLAIEQSGGASLLNSLIGQQSVTQRWLSGQLSNFQYIMSLNTLAGRSYNDLSQYPVFPWVLADYSSETLDLTVSSTFRDFSKPMGAQTPERLQQFLKRFEEWDDPSGETPPYMYGTHYSSAMIVVSYLVRLEPFTQQFLCLQGGHFDLADRMFHSVGDAWVSASRNNMADVKELIPEFFTLPELLINMNHFDLGTKQSGVSLDDVVLPAWAKGDAREFTRIHRLALESDFVSSHLHEWIDLVFGYKQKGDNAVQARNLFHHLFYEGNVDFDSIDDPLTRNATIAFVNNFGQIPSQLFKKPHPQKKVANGDGTFSSVPGVTTPRLFYHSLHCLRPPTSPIKELKSAVGSVLVTEKGVHALEQNRVFVGHSRYLAWGFPDRSIRMGAIDSEKSWCILELCDTSEVTCAAADDDRTLFAGSSDGCVEVWTLNHNRASTSARLSHRKTLDAHSDTVTCLTVCASHGFVVSASRDCSVMQWQLSDLSLIRQLPSQHAPVSAVAVNDATGDIATAAGLHLFVWSINGDLLASLAGPEGDLSNMILSIAFSTMNEWDSDNVVMCGSSDGVVNMYSVAMVENDGSLCRPEPPSCPRKPDPSSRAVVEHRLDRLRRRLLRHPLGVAAAASSSSPSLSISSSSQSPDPPASPLFPLSANSANPTRATPTEDRFVRVLAHRASLSTHTAFNRTDNPQPAPITSIAPSKDHKAVYIGDGIGRVWCWSLGDEAGGRADHWVQDLARQKCTQCHHKFSIADRRHHCRNCGQAFCAKCSRFESEITHMKISKAVRVCQSCYIRLKAQSSSS